MMHGGVGTALHGWAETREKDKRKRGKMSVTPCIGNHCYHLLQATSIRALCDGQSLTVLTQVYLLAMLTFNNLDL